MDQQPTLRVPREARRFDTTQLREAVHGQLVHRDYLAHFFRWQYARKCIVPGMRILDVGCGQDQPLVRILGHSMNTVPLLYVGCDLNRVTKASTTKWCTTLHQFDFTSRWHEVAALTKFDLIVCFEVIEHMGPEDGAKLLAGAKACLDDKGVFLLSTPVFSGTAARNHVHEFTAPELQGMIEAAGFAVKKRMGTFGDVAKVRQMLQPDELAVWDRLSTFLCNDALACFMSALYPDACKNNIWELRHQ